MLELANISAHYGTHQVLSPTSLDIGAGEFLTILGPSGSGKTTILRIVGGFLAPSAGKLLLNGQDISNLPPERRPFNTVFQDYALFPNMTVAENVAYSLRVKGRTRTERQASSTEALELVGLADFGGRDVSQLSGGQQQRVALARAIVAKPQVILLDEPLSALDASLRLQMQLFLKSMQRRLNATFVLVTHDQQEALALSDRIVVMEKGAVAQIGTPDEIYDQPKTPFVAGFIGRNNILAAEAAGFGRVRTSVGLIDIGNASIAPGSSIAIRPERIQIDTWPGMDQGTNARQGRVVELVFGGAQRTFIVELDDWPGQRLEVFMSVDDAYPAKRGDSVQLSFRPQDVRILTGAAE